MSVNISGIVDVSGVVKSSTIPSQQIIDSPVPTIRDVATDGNGNWVVVGSGPSNSTRVAYSSNRVDWTLSASTINSPATGVATDGIGNWVMILNDGGSYRSTDNGVTWAPTSGVKNPAIRIVFWAPGVGQFLAVGGNATITLNVDGSGRSNFSPAIPGSPSMQTAAVSPTRAVLAGDNGTSYYTDVGASWTASGLPVETIRGSWYEPTLGTYAFTDTGGEVHYSTTGNSGWTTDDINTGSAVEHRMIIFSPTEQKWVSSSTSGEYWKTVDTTLDIWTLETTEFVGAGFGLKADSDGTHYVIVTNSNKIVTR